MEKKEEIKIHPLTYLFVFVVFIVILVSCNSGEPDDKEAKTGYECREVSAFNYSTRFVKQKLKAPATAKFPSHSRSDGVSVVDLGSCNYHVTAWVDAQNSYGALIRTNYSMNISYNAATKMWTATDIRL